MTMIREMQLDDVVAVHTIEVAVTDFPWSLAEFFNCFQQGYFAWVVIRSELIVGFCIIKQVTIDAELMNIAIAPGYQRQGLGQILLQYVLDQCRQLDIMTIFLEVRAGNRAAQKLYQQVGFKQYHVRVGYYQAKTGREDALCLRYERS